MTQPRVRFRIAREIQYKLAQILRQDFSDQDLAKVTILEVLLVPDMKTAYIIFNMLGANEDARAMENTLATLAGRIAHHLARTWQRKRVPRLRFIAETNPEAMRLIIKYNPEGRFFSP